MNKSFKVEIYPDQDQEVLIEKTFGCVRYTYNFMLNLKQLLYKEFGISITLNRISKVLTMLKKLKLWLAEVDKCALQYVLKDLFVEKIICTKYLYS